MRVGLISDIHGNSVALDAVLAALQRASIDQLVCLGDVAVFGPDPRGVIARLRGLAVHLVQGNTDAWALDPQPHAWRNAETPFFNAVELWSAQQLDADDCAFLRSFVPHLTLDLGKTQLLCYHGSPRSFHEGIFAHTTDDELAAIFEGFPPKLAAGGHTHVQLLRRFGDKMLINPGSVGQPFEYAPGAAHVRHPPWAEYAIVEASGGCLSVALHRTPVDVEALLALAAASGMPHLEWWARPWHQAAG